MLLDISVATLVARARGANPDFCTFQAAEMITMVVPELVKETAFDYLVER